MSRRLYQQLTYFSYISCQHLLIASEKKTRVKNFSSASKQRLKRRLQLGNSKINKALPHYHLDFSSSWFSLRVSLLSSDSCAVSDKAVSRAIFKRGELIWFHRSTQCCLLWQHSSVREVNLQQLFFGFAKAPVGDLDTAKQSTGLISLRVVSRRCGVWYTPPLWTD